MSGTPTYEQSWNLITEIMNFFINLHLRKDLNWLDCIDSRHANSLTPIARRRIRQKNYENANIRAKYFNEKFNLKEFTMTCINNFILGMTWRWIGGDHKMHMQCLKMVKIIAESGLVNESELDDIKQLLYLKM